MKHAFMPYTYGERILLMLELYFQLKSLVARRFNSYFEQLIDRYYKLNCGSNSENVQHFKSYKLHLEIISCSNKE